MCVFTLAYLFYVLSSLAPEKLRGFHLSPKIIVKQIIARCLLFENTYMLDFHLPLKERLEMKMSFLFLSKKCIEWRFLSKIEYELLFLERVLKCKDTKKCRRTCAIRIPPT